MTLYVLAWISIGLAVACALVIAADEVRDPQHMRVMNIVWPVTALYFSIFALWAYLKLGRKRTAAAMRHMEPQHSHKQSSSSREGTPGIAAIALGTSHCGAGCMLADVITDFAIAGAGLTLFGSPLTTEYLLDFVAAWALGIAFQYFAIRPMRSDLSSGAIVWAAIKADTLSITAFQVGMYLFMALVYFRLFPQPHHLTPFDPRYWLMMQIAMVCGFATSLPMNGLLLHWGWKEAM